MRSFVSKSRCLKATLAVILLIASERACFAQTAKYNDSYTIQGFSQPSRISSVASSIPGIVKSLSVREGDRVSEGDCVLRLDQSVHDTKLEFARVSKESLGELEAAKAEHAAHATRLERLRDLISRKHASQVELLQAEEDYAVSRASVRRAQDRLDQQTAEYARLKAESDQHCIKAPFAGVLVEFKKQVGEYVGPGESTVCKIADLESLLVEFLVPGHFRHNLNVNDDVQVLFTVANRQIRGTIEYISPFPNGETNTYQLKVRVDNSKGDLTAGERCILQGFNQPTGINQPSLSPSDATVDRAHTRRP